jgi:predicted nucleic acid-binding protein
MAVAYFDSSAFVKLVIEEEGTDDAIALWDAADVIVSSHLAYPDVCAALAAAARDRRLSRAAARRAAAEWSDTWDDVRTVALTDEVAREAGALATEHALRGADAIHLASALAIGTDAAIVAVWDRQLHRAMMAAGFRVVPASV